MNLLVRQVNDMRGSALQRIDWDSYGALPITDETLDAAEQVAKLLDGTTIYGKRITEVTPVCCGGVEFSDSDETVWIEVQTD